MRNRRQLPEMPKPPAPDLEMTLEVDLTEVEKDFADVGGSVYAFLAFYHDLVGARNIRSSFGDWEDDGGS